MHECENLIDSTRSSITKTSIMESIISTLIIRERETIRTINKKKTRTMRMMKV